MYLTIIFLTLISSLIVGLSGRFFGFHGSAILSTSCLILAFIVSTFIFYEVAFIGCFSFDEHDNRRDEMSTSSGPTSNSHKHL